MPLHIGHKVNSLCSPAKNKLKTIPVGVIYARSDVAYALSGLVLGHIRKPVRALLTYVN